MTIQQLSPGIGFRPPLDHRASETLLLRRLAYLEKIAAIGEALTAVSHELDAALADHNTDRASSIVRSFLLIGQPIEKRQWQSCDLNRIVRRVLNLRCFETQAQNIVVSCDLDANLPAVAADPDGLTRVVLALVVSAERTVLNDRGAVRLVHIQTQPADGGVRLLLTASGLPDRLLASLSACAENANDFGGRLQTFCSVDRGSVFVLDLPG